MQYTTIFSHLVDDTTQCVPTPSKNINTWALVLTMPSPSLSLLLLPPNLLSRGAAQVGRTRLSDGLNVAVKEMATWHPFLESHVRLSDANS